ncbi:uncharacterized protein BO80DRAFT_423273 [Aspergillus ibericus CBS 121593]|uniref:Aminoglycoside phosphotransferase domain-containing protein n=1 Tax=Aspergillus ibericus CBS 121593 TaxID=1448316 RepID=A0A395H6V0_9EURO|nr:hypothetical protein BO80DRAFT_423273 [Aspergillus ibericus CBS 121593]RAL03370.1 hypothetical protein BO80DRAFT_423273 [Aspergillus ibericus CBS 121593]
MAPINLDPSRVARPMLARHSLDLVSCTTLQTLWAGYGHICAITARATTPEAATRLSALCGVASQGIGTIYPLILKLIAPPRGTTGATEEEGHLRKMFSYEVEQCFYSEVVPQLADTVAVARCVASTRGMAEREAEFPGLMATIMVDLRPRFPVAGGRRSALSPTQVHGALAWLAGFHGGSRNLRPDNNWEAYVLPPLQESRRRQTRPDAGNGLWLNGGYTYLETRRKEYAALAQDTESEWSDALCRESDGDSMSVAEMVALVLSPCGRPMESYIHGDVKSENLFTTTQGTQVAFFDFQYVGLGLGVCDLAKLFTCSVPLEMLVDAGEPLPEQLTMQAGEKRLLEWYRTRLLEGEASDPYPWELFQRHWEVALVDWCRFQASWGFWGNTEWLEARVRSILNDQEWRDWLKVDISSRSG